MHSRMLAVACAVVLGAPGSIEAQAYERARANDNRARAGIAMGAQLAVRMEARLVMWHPDGDDKPGIQVPAFAEQGRPASVPGPLIRATGGTDVIVMLRNAIPGTTLVVHGLHGRPVEPGLPGDSVVLASGEFRNVRFRLDRPGTYFYWGTISGRSFGNRTHEDAQLTGAIVVDEPGQRTLRDRVFVIGMMTDTAATDSIRRRHRELVVINGRSWPAGDRIQYERGDLVRWRVINASVDAHPMHLHGFYFRVTRRGDAMVDTALLNREEVLHTERVAPGGTFHATWVADKLGNWVFQCEEPEHSSLRAPLGLPSNWAPNAARGMGGLVAGVEIKHAEGDTSWRIPPAPPPAPVRRMRLVLRPHPASTTAMPIYGVSLEEGGLVTFPDTAQHAGPALLLNRGELTSVTIVNQLPEPTAIHWHGIEGESLYDGVPGFSGFRPPPLPARLNLPQPTGPFFAPLIMPSDSFEVRLAPPKAGTFAYHAQVNTGRQQGAGIVGAIVVAEKGKHDATREMTVLVSSPADSAAEETSVLLNGSLVPRLVELRRGIPYRMRLLNFTTGRPDVVLDLVQDSSLTTWRPVARDGIDLPLAERGPQPARMRVSMGQTRDIEYTAVRAGDLRLEARTPSGLLLATLPIRVN